MRLSILLSLLAICSSLVDCKNVSINKVNSSSNSSYTHFNKQERLKALKKESFKLSSATLKPKSSVKLVELLAAKVNKSIASTTHVVANLEGKHSTAKNNLVTKEPIERSDQKDGERGGGKDVAGRKDGKDEAGRKDGKDKSGKASKDEGGKGGKDEGGKGDKYEGGKGGKEGKEVGEKGEVPASIHLIGWGWENVGVFLTFAIFVSFVGYAKVGFHHTRFLASYFPESFLMIALGAAVGFVMTVLGYRMPLDLDQEFEAEALTALPTSRLVSALPSSERKPIDRATFPDFTPKLYFLILIPPIILEQAYALYGSDFAYNVYPILLFSVCGKVLNTLIIGPILYVVSVQKIIPPLPLSSVNETKGGLLSLTDSLVFSSIISAVDPAPVLEILHEAGVHKRLYFLIFGESLLNDAVTTTLYSSAVKFTAPSILQNNSNYSLAALAFVVRCLGGFLIGIVFGLISALATRATWHHRTVEPLTLLGLAYIAYLLAEVIHFSGHICLLSCGLLQAHYAFKNISFISYTSTIHFVKMLSSTCDAVILLFLGMAMVNFSHVWHTGFVLWTLGLCFGSRVIGIYVLGMVHNSFSSRWINFNDQTLLAYCGLRGALCLCLAHMLNETRVPFKSLFVTTTLVVILVTTLVQGGSLRLILSCLRIKRNKHHVETLNEILADSVFTWLQHGFKSIAQVNDSGFIKKTLRNIDEKYLKKIFLAPNVDHGLYKMYHTLIMENFPKYSRATSKTGQRKKKRVPDFQRDTNQQMNKISPATSLPWEQNRELRHRRVREVQNKKEHMTMNDYHNDHNARMMQPYYEEYGSHGSRVHLKLGQPTSQEYDQEKLHRTQKLAAERLSAMVPCSNK